MALITSQEFDYYSLHSFPVAPVGSRFSSQVKLNATDSTNNLRLKLESGANDLTIRVENYSASPISFSTVSGELNAWFEIFTESAWRPMLRPYGICGTGLTFYDVKLLAGNSWVYHRSLPKGDFRAKVRWAVRVGKKTFATKPIDVSMEAPKSVDNGHYDITITHKGQPGR